VAFASLVTYLALMPLMFAFVNDTTYFAVFSAPLILIDIFFLVDWVRF